MQFKAFSVFLNFKKKAFFLIYTNYPVNFFYPDKTFINNLSINKLLTIILYDKKNLNHSKLKKFLKVFLKKIFLLL